MKNFYIIENSGKEDTEKIRQEIVAYLREKGSRCEWSERTFEKGGRYTQETDVPEETECVITLGGDGTLIQAARDLAFRDVPIIGINMGTLGYLTQMGTDGDIKELLDSLVEDRYQIQDRMMLKGKVYHDGGLVSQDVALNDIVLTREGVLRVLRFRIYVDGEVLYEYAADGMIISTPTGSTAYNLSAGGPIAQPDGRLIIMTPVCPHALASRSIVLGAEKQVKIEICEPARGEQMVVFDGDRKVELAGGDYIEVEQAKAVTRLVRLDRQSFLDILKYKLYES